MKMILVDSNLVRTILVIICLILIMVCPLEKNYFLVRTKLVYLRYVCSDLEQKQKKLNIAASSPAKQNLNDCQCRQQWRILKNHGNIMNICLFGRITKQL